MKAGIRVDVTYPHPIARVWEALTTSEGLAAWLMPNDFKPVVGHRFTLHTEPAPGFDGVVHCEVLELDPPQRMVWSWSGGRIDTVVTFELTELDAARTRFRLRQVGFAGLRGTFARLVLEGGSARIYQERLPAYLDRLAGRASPSAAESAPCAEGWRSMLPWSRRR